MRIGFAVGLALAIAAPALMWVSPSWASEPAAKPAQATAGEDPDTVTLYSDGKQRMTVDVIINERGPFPFIVDTGSQGTVIARELAQTLALQNGPDATIHSMSVSKSVHTVVIPQLSANKLVVKKIIAPTAAQFNMGAAGILGLDALKSQRMLLDFKTGIMSLTPSDAPIDKWEGESITVSARSRMGQLILTDASVDDDRIQVILDTGNEVSVGNMALLRLLTARRAARSGGRDPITLLDVTGNRTEFDNTLINQMRIATLAFENVPIAFADAHMFKVLDLKRTPALLLGMDVLQLFGRVSVDFGKRQVRFQRAEAYKVPVAAKAAAPKAQ